MSTRAARRRSGALRVALALLAVATLVPRPLGAAGADPEWVVLEALGSAWQPGERIAPDAELNLAEGAFLEVVSASGQTRALRGPYRGSLRRALEQPDAPQDSRSFAIGATRGPAGNSIPRVELRPPIEVQLAPDAVVPTGWLESAAGIPDVRRASETEPADVHVRLAAQHVWLEAPASHAEARLRERVPRVGTELQQRALLRRSLAVVARANRLLRLASVAGPPPPELHVALHHERGGQRQPAVAGVALRVQHGDRIELALDNRASAPFDLNVFWVDARGRITCLFPADALQGNRLRPGAVERVRGEIDARETRGHEYLVVLGVRGQTQGGALVLAGIADASWSDAGSAAPTAPAGSPAQQLETARWQLEARSTACATCSLFATAFALETEDAPESASVRPEP